MKRLQEKFRSVNFLYPVVLVSIFPILFFYSANISILTPRFLTAMLTYSFAGSISVFLILLAVLRNSIKASIIDTILIFIFFSYGHVSESLNDYIFIKLPNGVIIGPDKILLPAISLIVVFLVFKVIKSKKSLAQILFTLNTILVFLTCYQLFAITNYSYQENKNKNQDTHLSENQPADSSNTLDIYHIILDGYARSDILGKYYDYDNSGFTNALKKMGFYVVERARTNYMHTYLSLPSTFNMTYLDFLPEKYGKNPTNGSAAVGLMLDNLVSQKLKGYGYTTVNFPSEWEGTNENYNAGIKYKRDTYSKILGLNFVTSETNMVFLQTTLLSPFIKKVWGDALRARILSIFEKLPDVPYLEGKKYTLAHILAPHPPYVFNKDGSAPDGLELQNADEQIAKRPRYRDQLIFVSDQIIPILQKLIVNSKNPPIIILQADHGPASILGRREDWNKNYSQEAVDERSAILLAIYFPDKNYKDLYQTMTPVNIYPIIFDKYFNENIKLLPDKTYYTNLDAIYGFVDITKDINELDKL